MVQDLATLEGTTKMTETDHAHPFTQISLQSLANLKVHFLKKGDKPKTKKTSIRRDRTGRDAPAGQAVSMSNLLRPATDKC